MKHGTKRLVGADKETVLKLMSVHKTSNKRIKRFTNDGTRVRMESGYEGGR